MMDYNFVSSNRAKRISITVQHGQVKVTVPKGISFEAAKPFVLSKQAWIEKQLRKYQDYLARQSQKNAAAQKSTTALNNYLYLGRTYPIRIIQVNNPRVEIACDGEGLFALLPHIITQSEGKQIIQQWLLKWYKERARTIFTEQLDYYSAQMGLCYNQLRIKEQKTKWGSCSGKKNINLNWRVIMAPLEVVNYLVIHELAHLKQMNHSADFWQLVAGYCPDYQQWRKWLRDHGEELNTWGKA